MGTWWISTDSLLHSLSSVPPVPTKIGRYTMNLNLINLEPTQWSKADWQDAYAEYCQYDMFGPKTKREYYDMVMENHRKEEERNKPLSDELKEKWIQGWCNAVNWARKHKCDRSGRSIWLTQKEREELEAKELAERAECIAADATQRLDHIIETIKRRRVAQ